MISFLLNHFMSKGLIKGLSRLFSSSEILRKLPRISINNFDVLQDIYYPKGIDIELVNRIPLLYDIKDRNDFLLRGLSMKSLLLNESEVEVKLILGCGKFEFLPYLKNTRKIIFFGIDKQFFYPIGLSSVIFEQGDITRFDFSHLFMPVGRIYCYGVFEYLSDQEITRTLENLRNLPMRNSTGSFEFELAVLTDSCQYQKFLIQKLKLPLVFRSENDYKKLLEILNPCDMYMNRRKYNNIAGFWVRF